MHVNPPTEYICGSGGGPRPHRTIEFSFPPPGFSVYTRVYVCHSNEKARVHCIFACDAHTYIHTQAHARVRRLYVRIDRLVATAEPWSDFNFYVERENFTLCLRWPSTRPRRRTEGRVARKVNLLSRTCARFYVKKTHHTKSIPKVAALLSVSLSMPKSVELAFACIRPSCHGEWGGPREICISLLRVRSHVWRVAACTCARMHFTYDKARSRNPPRFAIIIKLQATVGRGTLESSQLWNRCRRRLRFIPLF